MATKKDNENKDNLLQMIFDHIWYSIFPKPRIGTISQEELDEVFPIMPRILCITDKRINTEHKVLDIRTCKWDLSNLKI